jgi:hypothetical protein
VIYCKYMDNTNTTSLCFTAYDYQRIFILSSAFFALCLGSGCTSSSSGVSAGNTLVQPPRYDISAVQLAPSQDMVVGDLPVAPLYEVEPYVPQSHVVTDRVAYEAKGAAKKSCHVKDRFDRKELVAYEWGQNRMGFDVDGLGLTGGSVENVQFSYRLRLQNYKTKKERCRHNSSWQGLLGSSYNELVVRDDGRVGSELEAMEDRYAPW